jgi:hypothetical protein
VYLFSGADGSFIRQFNGQAMFGLFGSSVAGVGDIDGDGCPDIVIGAPTEYDGITIHGAVYIISVATGQVLHRIGDYHAADATGWSVAGVGDVDGDGVPDIAVGAPTTDWLAPGAGAVRIHSGATGELITGRFGHGPYANLGTSIARVGYARMIAAGAPAGGAPCGVNSAPASVVILDAGTGMLVRALFSPGELGFGASLAPIGDLNGDGMPEIAVGSPFYGVGKGRVYVYNFMNGAKLLEVTGEVGDRLGSAVAGAGDQSGDGIPDFLVGAPAHNSWIGQVQLRSGSDASLLRVMRGTPQAKTFGYAISDLGDINGDGVDDCIIGQDHGVGGAYIFTGFVNQFGFADFLPLPLTGSKTGFMTVADLDGNGSADIVTLNPSTNRLTVSYSNGDGSFMPPRHFPTLSKPTALAIADVNFDEKPDIIVTMAGSNRIAFYRNVGTGPERLGRCLSRKQYHRRLPRPAGVIPEPRQPLCLDRGLQGGQQPDPDWGRSPQRR